MERGLKYIIFDDGLNDNVVLFSKNITHANMVFNLRIAGTPISAGFVRIAEDGKLEAYGESISLKLKSRPEEDTILINREINR